MLLFFLIRKVLFWFWPGRRGEAPAGCGAEPRGAKAGSQNHWAPPAAVAASLVRQLRGPHLSTCPW